MRRRLGAMLVVAIVAGLFLLFGPKLPRDQSVRLGLGERARDVREVVVRYRAALDPKADKGDLTDEVLREVSFRYPNGEAPRQVRHEPRLADGDYVLEIDVVTNESRATVRRTIGLSGGTASIDIASAIPSGSSAPTLANDPGARP